jgi:hypothetical protein
MGKKTGIGIGEFLLFVALSLFIPNPAKKSTFLQVHVSLSHRPSEPVFSKISFLMLSVRHLRKGVCEIELRILKKRQEFLKKRQEFFGKCQEFFERCQEFQNSSQT